MIIGMTGTLGGGKGTIVEFLKEAGFKHFSASKDCINLEIIRRGLEINRDSMVLVANDLRAQHGPGYVADFLFEKARKEEGHVIIESIRTEGEINSLRSKGGFILLAVDADPKIRYERIKLRKSSKDNVSFERFLEDEKREFTSTDPNKQNLSRCIELADYRIDNNGTLEQLKQKTNEFLRWLQNEQTKLG